MSLPILYPSTETAFVTNGFGILSDALKCNVKEERNGMFELEMRYPITGVHYADIAQRSLITAKPNPVDDAQPFRVYRITKPMNGIVTVYAQHISYDLDGIPAQPFTAPNAPAAMQALKTNAVTPCPFTFWTDKTTSATMTNDVPQSLRSLLGGVRGSVLDVYGGEYAFDRYMVRLYNARGADRGVSIRYGKNLTSLEQDENCAAVYTGVYPYWTDSDGNLMQLPEKIVNAQGTYDFVRILTLDLSSEWQEKPTVAQLRTRAERYISENNIGVPKVSLSINFVQLEQYEEYKHLALQERVSLCDTVNVEFPRLGVSATAKVYKTVYDVLRDRWESVELGDARTTLADTIASQGEKIADAQKQTKTFLQQAIDSATALITGNKGGYVILHSSTGSKDPDEILIMDTPDISTAKKVWRWNKAGLGYSSKGYNGPYALAMTQDGKIVADFITTGTLNAALATITNINASNINTGTLNASLANIININASNINTGTLNANLIDVINLKAQNIISGILSSIDGNSKFDLNNGTISVETITEKGAQQIIEIISGKLSMFLDGNLSAQINSSETRNGGSVAVGSNGSVRAGLDAKPEAGRFMLFSPNNENLSRWVAGTNTITGQPYIIFMDSNYKRRIRLDIMESESADIGILRSDESYAWRVYEDANGNVCMNMKNKLGNTVFNVWETENGSASISLNDKYGTPIWQVYEDENGNAAVYQKNS